MNAERVIKGLECLLDINGGKYKHCLTCDYRHDVDHCQWTCQTDGILEDALSLLKAQEPTKFQIKTTISNVDIPKDVDEEQFFAVLSAQYAALAKLYGDDVPTYSPS